MTTLAQIQNLPSQRIELSGAYIAVNRDEFLSLSYQARGLLVTALAFPPYPQFKFDGTATLCKVVGMSRETILKYLKELIENGWCKRVDYFGCDSENSSKQHGQRSLYLFFNYCIKSHDSDTTQPSSNRKLPLEKIQRKNSEHSNNNFSHSEKNNNTPLPPKPKSIKVKQEGGKKSVLTKEKILQKSEPKSTYLTCHPLRLERFTKFIHDLGLNKLDDYLQNHKPHSLLFSKWKEFENTTHDISVINWDNAHRMGDVKRADLIQEIVGKAKIDDFRLAMREGRVNSPEEYLRHLKLQINP